METFFEGLQPAAKGKRLAAAVIDGVILCALLVGVAGYALPKLFGGFPLALGVLVVVLSYSVVPLAVFQATLGMKLFGLQLLGKDTRPVRVPDILFRELLVSGQMPLGMLLVEVWQVRAGILVTFLARLLHLADHLPYFLMLAIVGVALLGHFLAWFQQQGRGLADVLARSMVVEAIADVAPVDEDDRALWQRQRNSRWTKWGVTQVVLALVTAALGWVLMTPMEDSRTRLARQGAERLFKAEPWNEEAAAKLARHYVHLGDAEKVKAIWKEHVDAKLKPLLTRHEAEPCDAQVTLNLGDALWEAQRFEQAIQLIEKYDVDCKPVPRLWWVSFSSHKSLKQWEKAAEVATRILENNPYDSDYRWWRAEVLIELGQYEQAKVDLLQSMANLPGSYAASMWLKLHEKNQASDCEMLQVLRYLVDVGGSNQAVWAQREINDGAFSSAGCSASFGLGQASVQPGQVVTFQAAGKTLRGKIRSDVGYTLLSRSAAEKLQVDTRQGAPVDIVVSGLKAKGAKILIKNVHLAQAHLEELTVVVVDELPEKQEALLGINFLSAFKVNSQTQKWKLSKFQE